MNDSFQSCIFLMFMQMYSSKILIYTLIICHIRRHHSVMMRESELHFSVLQNCYCIRVYRVLTASNRSRNEYKVELSSFIECTDLSRNVLANDVPVTEYYLSKLPYQNFTCQSRIFFMFYLSTMWYLLKWLHLQFIQSFPQFRVTSSLRRRQNLY